MKSISQRLTLRIMMVVLAMMAVIAAVVYFAVSEYMDDEAEQRFQIVVTRAHREVQRRLSDVYVANVNSVHEIERDIDDPEKLSAHLGRIVRQNPSIVSCGLLFVPDYYPEKGRFFVPFATRDTADVVSVMRIDSVYHDYFDDDWYVERLKSDSADWVDPYFESPLLTTHIAPRLLTTYAIPIHNREGLPVAVLCSDLSLEDMRNDMLQNVRKGKKHYEQNVAHPSYCCIIDRNGRYILHPDKNRMLRDYLDANVTFKGGQGAVSAIVDGVPSWVCYRTVKHAEWTVVMVAPEDLIHRHGRMLNTTILAVMLIGLAAIYLFYRQQIRKITSPPAPLRPLGRRGGERKLRSPTARHQGRRRDTPVARLVRQHAAVARPVYRRTEDDDGPEVGHRERTVSCPQNPDVDAEDGHPRAPRPLDRRHAEPRQGRGWRPLRLLRA